MCWFYVHSYLQIILFSRVSSSVVVYGETDVGIVLEYMCNGELGHVLAHHRDAKAIFSGGGDEDGDVEEDGIGGGDDDDDDGVEGDSSALVMEEEEEERKDKNGREKEQLPLHSSTKGDRASPLLTSDNTTLDKQSFPQYRFLTPKLMKRIALGIAKGLQHMHSVGITHRVSPLTMKAFVDISLCSL